MTDPPKPPHLSFSAIADFITCGKLFELKRVHNLDGTPAYALAGGRAVHAAIEAYERRAFATRKESK